MNGGELSHCEPQVRAIALSGYQRMVELVADRMTHVKKEEAVAIASGVVSTMVGAVTMANLAPNKAAAAVILNDAHALIRTLLSASVVVAKTGAAGAKKLSSR
jgi:TetR/AcrR family transcriptional repressor of nem operon